MITLRLEVQIGYSFRNWETAYCNHIVIFDLYDDTMHENAHLCRSVSHKEPGVVSKSSLGQEVTHLGY